MFQRLPFHKLRQNHFRLKGNYLKAGKITIGKFINHIRIRSTDTLQIECNSGILGRRHNALSLFNWSTVYTQITDMTILCREYKFFDRTAIFVLCMATKLV